MPVVFASEESRQLLARNGWCALESLFRGGEPVLPGRHAHKEVARLTLAAVDGVRTVYVKRQWRHAGSSRGLRNLFPWLGKRADPTREWNGLAALRAVGLDAARPLALFFRRLSVRSAIVIEAVPPRLSLHQLMRRGDVAAMSPRQREALAGAIAALVRRIHGAGYVWRSLAAKHLYPEPTIDGGFRLWLIDCEGVRRSRNGRHAQRDLAGLLRSLVAAGAELEFLRRVETSVTQSTGTSTGLQHSKGRNSKERKGEPSNELARARDTILRRA